MCESCAWRGDVTQAVPFVRRCRVSMSGVRPPARERREPAEQACERHAKVNQKDVPRPHTRGCVYHHTARVRCLGLAPGRPRPCVRPRQAVAEATGVDRCTARVACPPAAGSRFRLGTVGTTTLYTCAAAAVYSTVYRSCIYTILHDEAALYTPLRVRVCWTLPPHAH